MVVLPVPWTMRLLDPLVMLPPMVRLEVVPSLRQVCEAPKITGVLILSRPGTAEPM